MADYINFEDSINSANIPPEKQPAPDISDDEFAQIIAEANEANRAAEFDPAAPDPSLAPEQPAPEKSGAEKTYNNVVFNIPTSMTYSFKSKNNGKEYTKVNYPMYRTNKNGKEEAKWNSFVLPKEFVKKDEYDKGLCFFSLPAGRSTVVSMDINNKYNLPKSTEVPNDKLQGYVNAGYEKYAENIKTYAMKNLATVQANDQISRAVKDSCASKMNFDFNPPEEVKARMSPVRHAAKIIRNHKLNAYSEKGMVENARGYLKYRKAQEAKEASPKVKETDTAR